jgi:hypothetical protein
MLGRLVRRVVAAGLGHDGLSAVGHASRCPDCRRIDEERSHLVEAAVIEERSEPVDEVADLVAVAELSYLTLEARNAIESRVRRGFSFVRDARAGRLRGRQLARLTVARTVLSSGMTRSISAARSAREILRARDRC